MTPTATYIAEENCLQELPRMIRPEDWHYWHEDEYNAKLADYKTHLATLRKIPCDPSCKGLWQDQQEVAEGKDYEIKFVQCPECWLLAESFNCPNCKHIAFPLVPVKSEEKTFMLSELKEIIRSRMYAMENGRQPREGCNALFYNLIYFLEHGEEDPNA